jgi:Domain of unknown function (DUF4262)
VLWLRNLVVLVVLLVRPLVHGAGGHGKKGLCDVLEVRSSRPAGTGKLDEMYATMMRHGWAMHYVESALVPFAYTLGLTRHDSPELLVTGVSPQRAARLLNGVARKSVGRGHPCLARSSLCRPGLLSK